MERESYANESRAHRDEGRNEPCLQAKQRYPQHRGTFDGSGIFRRRRDLCGTYSLWCVAGRRVRAAPREAENVGAYPNAFAISVKLDILEAGTAGRVDNQDRET